MGLNGEAVITYVDDTSANRNQDTCGGCGETPAEAAGPVMVVSQNGGPSLLAGKAVPRNPKRFGGVQNKPGRAFLGIGGPGNKGPPAPPAPPPTLPPGGPQPLRNTPAPA